MPSWRWPSRRHSRAAALAGVSVGLVGWAVLLWHHLPRLGHTPASRLGWVVLDGAEATLFAAAAVTHLREHPAERAVMAAGAALLVGDAIVDVAVAADRRARASALLLVPVELGFAGWLWRLRAEAPRVSRR